MKTKRHTKLRNTLFLLTGLPILLLGTFFIIFAIKTVRAATEETIEKNLKSITTQLHYDVKSQYPGPYEIIDGKYYANGKDVTPAQEILNRYKENFNCEVSVFFGDTKALTTIRDSEGKLIVGTTQDNETILNAVFDGNFYTSNNVFINDEQYVVVYRPLYVGEEIEGMVFAGIKNEDFRSSIDGFYRFILGITFILLAVTGVIVVLYSNNIARMLNEIKDYLGNLVSAKNLDVNMEQEVLNRRDEIGALAAYAVGIGTQLNNIMGTDPLTGLYNRRSGRALLDNLRDQSFRQKTGFSIVMCDIDYFKNVNDTYGHDMGDVVLKRVSDIMINVCSTVPNSFAIRWGGEEILLGFMLPKEQTIKLVHTIQDSLKDITFKVDNDTSFTITATYGISSSEDCDDIHSAILEADDKLYEGKRSGRNTIVS